MEIIFESVEERDRFFEDSNCCPDDCGGKCTHWYCAERDCVECWEQSGVKYRIKNQPTPEHPVPIEEQAGCYTEIVINEPLRPGDKLVKKDGKFYVAKRPDGWWKDNPYLKVDIPKPDISPNEHWMNKKIDDYIREVTIGDIQMFCSGNSNFEEKKEVLKVCANCKHNNNMHNWPCMHCGCISRDMFEPKDAK